MRLFRELAGQFKSWPGQLAKDVEVGLANFSKIQENHDDSKFRKLHYHMYAILMRRSGLVHILLRKLWSSEHLAVQYIRR